MKAPGYQNINNIKLMQQNIGCNILAFSDILEDLTSSVTKVKKDEYSLLIKGKSLLQDIIIQIKESLLVVLISYLEITREYLNM